MNVFFIFFRFANNCSRFTQKGTFKTTCIYSILMRVYETNGVYVRKCMSIHVGVYMYTRGIYQPLHMHV